MFGMCMFFLRKANSTVQIFFYLKSEKLPHFTNIDPLLLSSLFPLLIYIQIQNHPQRNPSNRNANTQTNRPQNQIHPLLHIRK